LQPHRAETFKLSKDPLFIEKVRDIVGLYLNPPDKALVLPFGGPRSRGRSCHAVLDMDAAREGHEEPR
jgi:pyruvate-formate lyase